METYLVNINVGFAACFDWLFSTRGLGKALAREFLLSGDRVIVASRRWYLILLNVYL